MFSFLSPSKLASKSARHPWLTIGLWAVLVAAAFISAGNMNVNDEQTIDGSDSLRAERLLEDLRGDAVPTESVVIVSDGATAGDPAFRTLAERLTAELRALDVVVSATNFYETGDGGLVSQDRTKMIIPLVITGEAADAADAADIIEPVVKAVHDANGNGFTVLTVGDGSISKEFNETFESDLASAEMIGIPAALVVLLFVFGAAVAAGVPVVLALLGILVSVGITAVISRFTPVNSIVTNMITMIGLAVGIDYTLFIVERFREERAKGTEKIEAIVTSGNTASRAVLFSGITVMIAVAGMFIVPSNMFRSLAIGAMAAVFAAVLVALTLLPAMLSVLGDKINWLPLPGRKTRVSEVESESGFWGRTTSAVMRHPVLAIVGSVGILVAAAAPAATMEIGSPGLRDAPQKLNSVKAFNVLDTDFSAGRLSPTDIVIEGDNVNSRDVQIAITNLRASVVGDKDISSVGELEVNDDGTVAALPVIIDGDSLGADARAAVNRLRDNYIPTAFGGTDVDVIVGGDAASTTDYVETMVFYLPLVIAFVLTLSFVLLLLVFRSIIIPVKAILMNLLSVGAAYGLIVLVFQHGVGTGLFGFQRTDSIAAFLPIFLFTVLFGLSMDYHVFLLTRIQERFLQTGDNAAAVSYGLRSTAHIITGAAAIMMVVFGGFAMGSMVEMQQMGFGLAIAVLIDATIVRSILVPASMEMLGAWNWYLPSWLGWLPRIHVEGAPEPAVETAPAPAPAPQPAFELAGAGGD